MKVIIHKKKKTIHIKYETLFCILSILLILIGVIESSLVSELFPISKYCIYLICLLFYVLALLKREHSKAEIYWYTLSVVVGLLSALLSHTLTLLIITAFVFASLGVDYEKILKTTWATLLFGMIAVFAFDYAGLLLPIRFYRGSSIRYMFGFKHPNTFAMYLMAFNCAYFLWRGRKSKWFEFIILLCSIYIMFFLNHSNTVAICTSLFFVTSFNYRYIDIWKRVLSYSTKTMKYGIVFFVPIIIMGILIYIDSASSFSFFNDLKNTAGMRIVYGNIALKKYGLSLFGNQMKTFGSFETSRMFASNSYFVVDCLYVLLAVREGIASSIIIWTTMIMSAQASISRQRWDMLGVVIIMFVYSLMESGLTNSAFYYVFAYSTFRMHMQSGRRREAEILE